MPFGSPMARCFRDSRKRTVPIFSVYRRRMLNVSCSLKNGLCAPENSLFVIVPEAFETIFIQKDRGETGLCAEIHSYCRITNARKDMGKVVVDERDVFCSPGAIQHRNGFHGRSPGDKTVGHWRRIPPNEIARNGDPRGKLLLVLKWLRQKVRQTRFTSKSGINSK
jgi:hypothetical protein